MCKYTLIVITDIDKITKLASQMRHFCCRKSHSGQAWGLLYATSNSNLIASVKFILNESKHQIRTIIPPRPVVSTLVYLDYYGRAVRDGV